MKKIIIVLLITAFLGNTSKAQDLIKQVPADASLVIEMDLSAIKMHMGDKINTLNKKMALPVFKYSSIPFAKLFNTAESGLSMDKKAYFFMQAGNSYWVLPLNNESLFKSIVLESASKSFSIDTMPYDFVKSNGAEVLFNNNYGVVIKDNIAILTKGPRINTYSYYGGTYEMKEELKELKEYMRSEEITDSDEVVSPEVKAKIEEIIAAYDKERMDEEKQKHDHIDAPEIIYDEDLYQMEDAETEAIEATEEPIYSEEYDYDEKVESAGDAVDEAAEEATEAADEIEESPYKDYDSEGYDAIKIEAVKKPSYRYNWNHPVLQAFDEAWKQYKERKRKMVYVEQNEKSTLQAIKFIDSEEKNSIKANKQFNSDFSSTHDMGIWISEAFPFQFTDMMSRGYGMLNWGKMSSLFSGNHGVLYLDVKDKSIDIAGNQFMGKEFSKYQSMVSRRLNKKFIKYLPKTTSGVYAMNINQDGIYNMYRDLYGKILNSLEKNRGMDYSGGIDLFDMFINKDMLLNTLSGDGIVALTGSTQIISTKRRYLFDSTAFERTWQSVPDTNVIPEMMSMFTIKNKENLEKFLNAMIKLKVLKKKGDNYFIDLYYGRSSRKQSPEKAMWTLGIKKNVFFITNSQQVQMNKGLITHNAKKEMSEEICSLLKKEGNFVYWDHEAGVSSFPIGTFGSRRFTRMATISSDYFKNAKMVSKQTSKDSYAIKASFNFNEDNKENGLLQFIEMFQKMNERN